MPYIHVAITKKPDPALSKAIAAKVSTLTNQHLGKDPSITAIHITYSDPAHWFAGGQSLTAQSGNSFWLDIKVVDGTNTKQQIGAYSKAMFSALSELIGDVHEESYILVHEVPASAYGYGGKTQEYRYITGNTAT